MHGAAKPQRTLRDEIERCAYAVIGAAIEVHRALGPGFLESIYEEALAIELHHRRLRFQRQLTLPILYREIVIGEHRLDFVVEDEIVLELKAVERIAPVHFAQVNSYLRAGAYDLGLLINFEVPVLKDGVRRIIAKDDPLPP